MKKSMMLVLLLSSSFLMLSCSTSSTNNPKSVAKDFFEAYIKKNYEEASKHLTKDTKTALELEKSLRSMSEAFILDSLKASKAPIDVEYGEAEINGDMATVPITKNGEIIDIRLKKEDGAWKVAFDKDMMKQLAAEKTGKSVKEMNVDLDKAMDQIRNIDMDSLNKAMQKMQEVLGSDTLKKALNDAGEVLNKVGDALKQASKKQ